MPVEKQPPDLRQLSYFLAVAETRAISSAAARLGLAQPTLSEAVSKLEKQLDVQLLVRGVRGVHLTDAGLALARHAREMLRSMEVAIEEVRYLGGKACGLVSVGFPPSLAHVLSVPLAETAQVDHPKMRLRIAEGLSGHILSWIADGELSLGVVYQGLDLSGFDSKLLVTEEMFLATAPDNWEHTGDDAGIVRKPIGFELAGSLPLVLPSRSHGARELYERYAKAAGIQLNVVLELDSLREIIAFTSRASAYTILPHAAVLEEVSRGELLLVPIVDPMIRRNAYVVRKQGHPVTQASLEVEAMIACILRESVRRHHLRVQFPLMD